MTCILISTNYLFITKQNIKQSEITNMEIDSVFNTASDALDVIARTNNNTIADAMSDAAFDAIKATGNGGASAVCSKLAAGGANDISLKASSYIDTTLAQVNSLVQPTTITYSKTLTIDSSQCAGGTIKLIASLPLNVSRSTSSTILSNQVISTTKTMLITFATNTYRIRISDSVYNLAQYEFDKQVSCSGVNSCTPL